jgi:hypothetical protein
MFKGIFGFLLTLVVLTVGGLYLGYGEVEPCKVLAVERERRAADAGVIEGTVDRLTAGSTEGMSATECVSGLLDSWGERLN